MTVVGFHASHEQVHPAALLTAVRQAEHAGFTAAMCSDHFAPWSARQGHSGFAWSWLGAALQATSLPFGVVNAPGQRYHPAIIAQAAATLEAMYPGRFWVALGSGEAVNEHITGDGWPDKQRRNQRLLESATTMHRLLAGEEVSFRGEVILDRAKLWSLPDAPPPLCWDLDSTEAFDLAAAHVPPEAMPNTVQVSADLGRHADWLNEVIGLGFDEVYVHHVGREQSAFIDAFGQHVLPQLSVTRRNRHEDHRHQRPVVEERRRVLPGRRDLHGLERRRARRLRGTGQPAGLPVRPRHHLPVADAVLPHPRPR